MFKKLKNWQLYVLTAFIVAGLFVSQLSIHSEPPHNNLVIAAGETWGTYGPANYDYNWPRAPVVTDVTSIGAYNPQGTMFYTSRWITSGQFGNPPWSWMSGKIGMDFTNWLNAVEFNPTDQFASANDGLVSYDGPANYAYLKYTPNVAGANNPDRNYHQSGGSNLSADKSHAWATSAWPTTLGVDVKLTVHSWTMPYGHLDDFHLVEIELHNTGKPDLDADGTVDFENNKIHALNFLYIPNSCFHFRITSGGGRTYYVSNNRFRGTIIDQTKDEQGAPWDIQCQAIGSTFHPKSKMDHHATSRQGEYYDAYNGYGWLGAKKLNPQTGEWEEKFLCFEDEQGNQIVPSIGEGEQRGWFRTGQPGWNDVYDYLEKKAHIASMGAFFVDGGKSNDGAAFDLNPNPAMFKSGTAGDPTTFVVKDPSEWEYPDGAYELANGAWDVADPIHAYDPVTGEDLGVNPLDSKSPGRAGAMEPGIIKRGVISEYMFDGDPIIGFGPFSIEVGETVRMYFYRGSGFRIQGLRKTVEAARAVFESIQPDGSIQVPDAPPVPEIKVSGSANVKPLIKWQDPGNIEEIDGIKIYKCKAWPRYSSLEKLYPTHDTWWKINDPNTDPGIAAWGINPLMTNMDYVKDQQGNYWGPYELVKRIPASDFENYINTADDANDYPYAWEDDTYTAPGQSYWYYVSSYREGAANNVPAAYQGLDDVSWLESGKVNINGRTGKWESTWPWSWRHAYYPDETETRALKDLGAPFELVSPPAKISSIELGKTKIGVRPNPYKRTAFHDASGKHQLMFYNLPQHCTIQVYDLSGMLIDEIKFDAPTENRGIFFWDMYSQYGNELASGLYIWVVKYDEGMQKGKFAIIR